MTATQPDSDGTATQAKSGLTRRGVMRKTAIGIGATATAGYGIASDRSPVGNAQAFPPALIPAAAAVGALAYGEFIAGPDDEEVADSLEWQDHVNEFTRAREDELTLDQTLSSLRRDVQLIQNKAREEAIFAAYEQGVDSGSEADATAAVEDAITDSFVVVQKSVLESWNLRSSRYDPLRTNLSDSTDIDQEQWLDWRDTRDDDPIVSSVEFSNTDHTLFDDDVFQVFGHTDDDSDYEVVLNPVVWADHGIDYTPTDRYTDRVDVVEPDPNDYDTVDEPLDVSYSRATILSARPWGEILIDLRDEYQSMMDETQSIVDTYYQAALDGEIDLHNMIGPRHLTDTASTAEDYQEAAMALRGMGYPMSDQVCTVSITDDEGETHERIGRLSWTAHDGNTLAVGTELNPDNIVGSVFFAHNEPQDDGSIVGQTRELNRPFTIETAEGSDGVSFEDRTLVEADTQLTDEEIQDLFAEHYAANEEARENVHDTATDGGGAGGFLDGDASDIRTLGIVAGGAALAALLFGNN